MYEEISIDEIIPHPNNSNRISKAFSKKLKHNIREIGFYETITVRQHPLEKGKYEILNGHARIDALRILGHNSVKCDIWDVGDNEASLFLAVLNKLRGSEVPELRMSLFFDLLERYTKEELVAHVPENSSYLKKLELLPEEILKEEKEEADLPEIAIITFYLDFSKHQVVTNILNSIKDEYGLPDSSEALYKLVLLYHKMNHDVI